MDVATRCIKPAQPSSDWCKPFCKTQKPKFFFSIQFSNAVCVLVTNNDEIAFEEIFLLIEPHRFLSFKFTFNSRLFCAGVSLLKLVGLIPNHLSRFTSIHIILPTSFLQQKISLSIFVQVIIFDFQNCRRQRLLSILLDDKGSDTNN